MLASYSHTTSVLSLGYWRVVKERADMMVRNIFDGLDKHSFLNLHVTAVMFGSPL